MQRIVNLDTDHYTIWDSSLDAPVVHIQTYEELKAYIESWPVTDYNSSTKRNIFLGLLDKARKWGVSTQLVDSDLAKDQINELISRNRAGDEEETLSLEEIIEKYSNKQLKIMSF